jgi:hypothetical protein
MDDPVAYLEFHDLLLALCGEKKNTSLIKGLVLSLSIFRVCMDYIIEWRWIV